MEYLTEKEIDQLKPLTYAYAGFGRRFVAYLVDGLVLGVIGAAVWFGVGYVWISLAGDDELSRTILSAIINLAYVFITWFYFAVQESSEAKATLGKRLMGIFVTDMQGEQISFGRATGRFFSKILSSIFMIGYIMTGFTARKQALHDLIAGTLVIHAHA